MVSLVVALFGTQVPPAQPTDTTNIRPLLESTTRIRALNDGVLDARPLLQCGLEKSPTIRRLAAALEATDVVVLLELRNDMKVGSGELRLMTAAAGVRRLLVRIDARNPLPDRLKWLGHELQHALEVASAPEVRDNAAMVHLFTRIGTLIDNGFETDAAMRAGHEAFREVFLGRSKKSQD